ncbi:MAG: hypothetical protein RR370_01935 [Synergistaceae bacterium]
MEEKNKYKANGQYTISSIYDGDTSYLHIKYSNVACPTLSSQMNETGGDYIGQYTDFITADSDDPKKYTWTKVKGTNGISVNLTRDHYVFKKDKNNQISNYQNGYTTMILIDGSSQVSFDDCDQFKDANNNLLYMTQDGQVTIKATEIIDAKTVINQPLKLKIENPENIYGTVYYYKKEDAGSSSSSLKDKTALSGLTFVTTKIGIVPSEEELPLTLTGSVDLSVSYKGVIYTQQFSFSLMQDGINGVDGRPGENGNIGTPGEKGEDSYTILFSKTNSTILCDYQGKPKLEAPYSKNEITVYHGYEKLSYWDGQPATKKTDEYFTLQDSAFQKIGFDKLISGYDIELIGDVNPPLNLTYIDITNAKTTIDIPIIVSVFNKEKKQSFNFNWGITKTLSPDENSLKDLLTTSNVYRGIFTGTDANGLPIYAKDDNDKFIYENGEKVLALGIKADAIATKYLSAKRIDFDGAQMLDANDQSIFSISKENGIYMEGNIHILKVCDADASVTDSTNRATQPFLIERQIKSKDSNGNITLTKPEQLVYFSLNEKDENFYIDKATIPTMTVTNKISLGKMFDVVVNENITLGSTGETSSGSESHIVLL